MASSGRGNGSHKGCLSAMHVWTFLLVSSSMLLSFTVESSKGAAAAEASVKADGGKECTTTLHMSREAGSEEGGLSRGEAPVVEAPSIEMQTRSTNGKSGEDGPFKEVLGTTDEKAVSCTSQGRLGLRSGTEQPAASVPTVVVVGGGLAGLSAAIEILRGGGNVVIVEKCAKLGGNSAKASSGINAAGSRPQRDQGIPDNPEDFNMDTLRSGKGHSVAELVTVLVNGSASAIDFLESFGIDLSSITQLGGHSHPRTHRNKADGTAMNLGYRVMSKLIKYVEQQPVERVRLLTGMRASSLLRDGAHGRGVVGVRVMPDAGGAVGQGGRPGSGEAQVEEGEVEVRGGSVVLATGGFSADREGFLSEYVPKFSRLPTTNGPFAVGQGLKIAVEAGAALVDMDQVQLHPTGFIDPKDPNSQTKFLAPEALRGCGGILLNAQGQRFVDELSTRDAVVAAMMESCQPPKGSEAHLTKETDSDGVSPVVAYMLLNDASLEKFDPAIAAFYIKRGLIQKFQDMEELSRTYRLPSENVAATLRAYGTGGEADSFGKMRFPTLFRHDEVLYGAMVTPVLHYCMGGLRIGTQGEVFDNGGAPIEGLFAAGEVTGGVHGGNRLAGNSLLECVVFGRIAGKRALCDASFGAGVSSL